MKLNSMFIAVASLVSSLAFAGPMFGPKTRPENLKLKCPEGTVQYGGMDTHIEGYVCQRTDVAKTRHGPYVVFWLNGTIQSEGQFENGVKTGHWYFYDQKGVKTQETDFKGPVYHGTHVEFHPNGQRKIVASYVEGHQQGMEHRYDLTGKLITSVEFQNDRPVAVKK